MKELIIKKSNAATAYRNADAKGKKLLEDLIGKDNLQPEKITDRIKTFEDVLNEMSGSATQDVCDLLNYKTEDPDMISAKAYIKLVLIARALNEGWTPDWSNRSECKYVPWFKHRAGFGLSYVGYGSWLTSTFVSSRLCFKTSDLAEYAGTQFADIYNDFLTIK